MQGAAIQEFVILTVASKIPGCPELDDLNVKRHLIHVISNWRAMALNRRRSKEAKQAALLSGEEPDPKLLQQLYYTFIKQLFLGSDDGNVGLLNLEPKLEPLEVITPQYGSLPTG